MNRNKLGSFHSVDIQSKQIILTFQSNRKHPSSNEIIYTHIYKYKYINTFKTCMRCIYTLKLASEEFDLSNSV